MTTTRLVPCLLVLFLSVPASPAQEWTRFRGPNGTGQSDAEGIPVQWSAKDCRWRVELPGKGHSSPVVWGDRVYATSALAEDATQVVRALSAADGSTVWERRFESAVHPKHQYNWYASSTPTVDADRLYFVFSTPERITMVAMDRTTGNDVWRRELPGFVAQHGFGSSPVLFDGMVILANEQDETSSIVALDAATGKDRWSCPRRTEKAAYATPCILAANRSSPQLIASSWAHGISGIDPHSGKLLWELPVFKYRVVSSPLVAGGLVFGSCGVGGVGRQQMAARPGNPAGGVEAAVAYELSGSLPYVCTPVAHGDLLFSWFDKGVVTCLDLPSGQVHWKERVGGDYFSSPIRVRDRIYNTSRDGEMVVLAAANEFKLLARFSLGEATYATPAVSGGSMYLRTLSHVMAVGGK